MDAPLCLSASHYFDLQDIKISFHYVDFYAKMLLVLDTRIKNSTTQRTIDSSISQPKSGHSKLKGEKNNKIRKRLTPLYNYY